MPEAAMDKNHFPARGKDYVRGTWQVFSMYAKTETCAMQLRPQEYLGLRVLTLDATHVIASALSAQFVHGSRSEFSREV